MDKVQKHNSFITI